MPRLFFQPPADNERGPAWLLNLFDGWLAFWADAGFQLGIHSEFGRIEFLLDVPDSAQRLVAAQLQTAYPGSRVVVIEPATDNRAAWTSWLRLIPDVFPLKPFNSTPDDVGREAIDPLAPLLEVLKAGRSGRIAATLWLQVRPFKERDRRIVKKRALRLTGEWRSRIVKKRFERVFRARSGWSSLQRWMCRPFVKSALVLPDDVARKLSVASMECELRLELRTLGPVNDPVKQRPWVVANSLNVLTTSGAVFIVEPKRRGSFMLTTEELATLWHPPTRNVAVPKLELAGFRQLEPPANLPSPQDADVLTLGRVCFRHEQQKFGMDREARRRHAYLIGKTGMGKTTLLQSVLTDDILAGRGCAVFDPHGDLATSLLNVIPKHRTNDVVLIDPADPEFAPAYNPLHVPKGGDGTLVADAVLMAFQKVFGMDESQAPRMLHILRNCLLTLVQMPDASLMSIQQLLINPMFRKTAAARVQNPMVKSFWQDEYERWKPQDRTLYIASLQNKLGAFLTNDKLQRIFGQPESRIDLRKIMDEGKILIVNLSKGTVGENTSNLLGTLLVTSLQLAAMSRANIPEADRRDFSIVIDEFQNYATPAIATFLSEARKYRTHLILSHQFTAQLPPEILAAVLGNVGSMMVFQLGADDAEMFARQLGGDLTPDHLMNIRRYHAYCRLLIDGIPSRPFSMTTIAARADRSHRATAVRRESQRRYCIKT